MDAAARSQFLLVVAGATAILVFATLVSRVLHVRHGGGPHAAVLANLEARIRSWWAMVALLTLAVLLGSAGILVLFGAVSMLALREFVMHAPQRVGDAWLDVTCGVLIVLQYALVAWGDVRLVGVGLPLAALVALPLAAVAAGGTRDLQTRIAHRVWWLAIAGWCLSHVPALLLLDGPRLEGRELLLVVWLVIVTQSSDVLQYVFGKLYGRRPIAPRISPDKTVEGFAGGVLSASALGTALGWMTPFDLPVAAAVALAMTLLGFLGGLVLSGIKRDLGIKDWGQSIRGHGGVLDRVDSLCLSAPALFHLARAMPG